ncbi:MAG TPA: response regulator [Leptolyngbyaceae cyanobacterium]
MNSLRFLLLEDSAIDADLIQAVLADGEMDFELLRVQTRADFLTALEHHCFDLILADYSLPAFDGISALEISRTQCPDIPFIFVSGTLGEEVAVEMLKGGATDYVLKQRLDRLVPSVRRALQEAQERAARQQAETQLYEYAERLRMMAEISRRFSETILDLQSLLNTVCSSIGSFIGDICILQLLSDDEQWLHISAVHHPDADAIALIHQIAAEHPQRSTEGLAARVLKTQQPLLMPVTSLRELQISVKPEYLPYLEKVTVNSLLMVPLRVRSRSIGCLSLIREKADTPYTLDEQTFFQDLADRAALAIDNAKLYQKSQEANRVKDEFLAMLSHELRSPLNAILGWLSLLRNRKLDEGMVKRALETVERNAKAQARLVEDLLDVSRILQGKLRLNLQPLEIFSLIESAVDTVRPLAEAKNISLQAALDPSIGKISGDSERIQQVIWNLLSNAVKFTPQGGRVSIRLEQIEADRNWDQPYVHQKTRCHPSQSPHYCAQITIQDTGQGIKPEFLPHIFERFRQADSSITRNHGGLGLGLAIVQHLVDLHGGKVTADSLGESQGATFTVQLPLLVEEPLKPAALSPKLSALDAAQNGAQLEGLRILIVDDDPDARMLMISIFQEYGAEVVTASSAREGFLILSSAATPFDLLLSDIGMPEEDGYTLLRRVRSLKPEQGGGITAIAITAYAREEDRKTALSASFNAHLAKPIDPTCLIQLVVELMGKSASRNRQESFQRR